MSTFWLQAPSRPKPLASPVSNSSRGTPVTRLVLALLVASMLAASAPDTFTDRFERLDRTRWSVFDGWSNGGVFLNDWRKSQVRSDRSGVALILQKTPVSKTGYSSGEIQS